MVIKCFLIFGEGIYILLEKNKSYLFLFYKKVVRNGI